MPNYDTARPRASPPIPEQLDGITSGEMNPELLKAEASLRDLVMTHGKKTGRRQRALEPAVSLREAPGIQYGLRIVQDPTDKNGTKTMVTYRLDGSEVAKDLLTLQDGSVQSLDPSLSVNQYPVDNDDPTLSFLRQVGDGFSKKIEEDEQERKRRKHYRRAKGRKAFVWTTATTAAAAGITAAGVGIYNKVTYDPEAVFDARGVVLEQDITEISSGESGPAGFSNRLYEGDYLDVEDIPEAGDEISVNDGLRRITVSRVTTMNSDADENGCSSVKITDGNPNTTLSAYTDVPPFPEGADLINTEISLASHGKLVNACVVDWVPGTDKQTIVVDLHAEKATN